jgi:hypothetical protein
LRDSIAPVSVSAAGIEVVRGNLTDERAAQILELWSRAGVVDGDRARERLAQVVTVALDEAGAVVGVNAVQEESIPLVGRRFWVYRSMLPAGSGDLVAPMLNSAFEVLQKEFQPGGQGPIGLCVLAANRAEMERRPAAVWPDTELMFAGYLPDDRQVRIRYFWGAKIGAGLPDSPSLDDALAHDYSLEDRFRIERLSESGSVTPEDVVALWTREGVLPEPLARRRVGQVQLVAITGEREVAGVSTIYRERSAQLRMELWYYRTFVAPPHRHSNLAAQLIFRNYELLERRFTSGEDAQPQGVIFELENEGMQRHLNNALWPHSGFTFIGEDPRGWHIRIRYFPGARVLAPPRLRT